MKKLLFLCALAVWVASCSHKSGAAKATTSNDGTAAVARGHAKWSDYTSAQYVNGQKIFRASCGSCHALPDPKAESAEKWPGIMKSMGPKAKLSAADQELVQRYLIATASK